jgi:hypothetical protein
MKNLTWTTCLTSAWLAAMCAGYLTLIAYKGTAGDVADSACDWPADSRIARDTERPTLLLFVHPHCPCTRASIAELVAILQETSESAKVVVAVWTPESCDSSWRDTEICQTLAAMNGVDVLFDAGGAESKRFGATTSGHACLYASSGRLLFHGGITGARGHVGPNAGHDAVRASIAGKPAKDCSPVYGCKIAP